MNRNWPQRVTNPPGVRRGEEFSQDTCKIWRKFEACAAIGYHHLLRIASNSPIQAHIRIGHARVVWSGASRSASIEERTDRTKPSAWRKGRRKTSRSVNAVVIARSENRCCPLG